MMHSQVVLQKEAMNGSHYRLSYINKGYARTVQSVTGKKYLSFTGSSKVLDDYSYPAQDLFIALPPNSQPSAQFVGVKQHTLGIGNIENVPKETNFQHSIKGFLWVNDSYCMHIEINPFWYDRASGEIQEVEEFSVEIDLPQSLLRQPQQISSSEASIIDNPKFGSLWKSQQPASSIAQTDSWIDYNAEYVKLGIAKDGIYRLRYYDLLSYGVPVGSLDPKTIKVYVKGKEIPLHVSGENDGVFDQSDYVEFLGRRNYGDARYREAVPYGSAYYEYLNVYSDTTIYWLTWSGSQGQRVDTTVSVSGIPSDTLRYYDELMHSERNVYYDFSLDPGNLTASLRKNDPDILENETWNEGNLDVGKLSVTFSVSNLYAGKPARAFVKLQDFASSIQQNAHNLSLSINNTATQYDSGFINKYQVKVLKAAFPSSVLKNGNNTIDIHSYTTASSPNTVIRDWYELEYPRFLKTTTDSLNFAYNNIASPTLAALSISGLSTNTFSLYRYRMNDSSIIKITNYTRTIDTLKFIDTVANGSYYFLLREDKIPAPIFYYKKKFTNLRNGSNQADYLAITHPYFQSTASDYIAFISTTYGVSTKLISTYDIYDEFNYGFFAPEPIKEFLKSTHAFWQLPKPQYVVLIGKGTYDYYGNKTRYAGVPPTPNYVPPYGNPVSDIWFVLWDTTSADPNN